MELHYLYTISDPRNGLVFYVGKTTNPKSRFSSHMSNKKTYVWPVISVIMEAGLKPIFNILKEGSGLDISRSEYDLVQELDFKGVKLANHCVNRLHRVLPYELTIGEGLSIKKEDLTILNRG